MDSYRDDLAYVHDAGFGRVAESAPRLVLEFLAAKGQPPARLLDLGCGTGIFAQVLAAHGHHVTGMDISPGMLRRIGFRARTLSAYGSFRFPKGMVGYWARKK
jgi:ubiquinone/menaquinone biosynthesis C-methylase UbiE